MTLSKKSAYFMLFAFSFIINVIFAGTVGRFSTISPVPNLPFIFMNLALGVLIFYKVSKPRNIIWWSAALCTVLGTLFYITIVYWFNRRRPPPDYIESLNIPLMWSRYILFTTISTVLYVLIFFLIINFSFKARVFTVRFNKDFFKTFIGFLILVIVVGFLYKLTEAKAIAVSGMTTLVYNIWYYFYEFFVLLTEILKTAAIMVTAMFIDKHMNSEVKNGGVMQEATKM